MRIMQEHSRFYVLEGGGVVEIFILKIDTYNWKYIYIGIFNAGLKLFYEKSSATENPAK